MKEIIIIEQVSPTEVIVECKRCNGSGRIGSYLSDPECSSCHGKGKVLIQCEKLPLVECARCNGSGRIGSYLSDPACKSCMGTGCQPIAGDWRVLS